MKIFFIHNIKWAMLTSIDFNQQPPAYFLLTSNSMSTDRCRNDGRKYKIWLFTRETEPRNFRFQQWKDTTGMLMYLQLVVTVTCTNKGYMHYSRRRKIKYMSVMDMRIWNCGRWLIDCIGLEVAREFSRRGAHETSLVLFCICHRMWHVFNW